MSDQAGKICLAAFPEQVVSVDPAGLAATGIHRHRIRETGAVSHRAKASKAKKRLDASLVHRQTLSMRDLPGAPCNTRRRGDDAIWVVVSMRNMETAVRAAG